MTRLRYHESSIRRRKPTEAGWGDGNDFLTYMQTLHIFSQSGNLARTLGSQWNWVPWVHSHRIQNVPIVQACCIDFDLDLTGAWLYAGGRLQPQCIQLSWLCNI